MRHAIPAQRAERLHVGIRLGRSAQRDEISPCAGTPAGIRRALDREIKCVHAIERERHASEQRSIRVADRVDCMHCWRERCRRKIRCLADGEQGRGASAGLRIALLNRHRVERPKAARRRNVDCGAVEYRRHAAHAADEVRRNRLRVIRSPVNRYELRGSCSRTRTRCDEIQSGGVRRRAERHPVGCASNVDDIMLSRHKRAGSLRRVFADEDIHQVGRIPRIPHDHDRAGI